MPLVFVALLVTLASSGCFGGSGKTKAGVESPKTLTLTMETPDGPDADAEYFIAQVKTRTHGRVRIIESSGPYSSVDADNELRLVRDLRRGKVKLAYIPSRAWERDGIDSFRALQAPFLVTDYTLLRRITTGPVARSMLDSLDRARLVGLGLVPNELRRPLGRRRLLSAADYRGARIRVITSPTSELVFRTLGATTVTNLDAHQALGALEGHRLDGVESSAHSMGEYTRAAPYLPSNLAFFAKTQTIVVARRVFERLSEEDQQGLRKAAAATVAHADPESQERHDLRHLCDQGLRLVRATPSDLASLRRATAPAHAALERDPVTRRTIARIERLKRDVPSSAATLPSCRRHGAASSRGQKSFPEGTFVTTLTERDYERAAQDKSIPLPDTITTTFRAGRWRMVETTPGHGPPWAVSGGRYAVSEEQVTFIYDHPREARGIRDILKWSYYRGELTFRAVDVGDTGRGLIYLVHPWHKVR